MKVISGRAKPEFDDVALAAAKTGSPPHEVASRAEEAWRADAARRPPHRVRRMHPPDGERHVPLRRGHDRPHPGGVPGTPLHGPGRPRLRRPGRVPRRRAGRADAARGQRRRAGAGALRRQAVDGGGLVRQPPLLVLHPGRPDQGLPALRHVRLVLVAARHLLARGGRCRGGREPGPRRSWPPRPACPTAPGAASWPAGRRATSPLSWWPATRRGTGATPTPPCDRSSR